MDGHDIVPGLNDPMVRLMARENHKPKETWTDQVFTASGRHVITPDFNKLPLWRVEGSVGEPLHIEKRCVVTCVADGQTWPCKTHAALLSGKYY